MGSMDGGSASLSQVDIPQSSLICGLPDDIALFCLARVPRKYHGLLKCVSKRWRDLICSDEWVAYRQKHTLDEAWIYSFCKDKFERVFCYVLDPSSPRRYWKLIEGLSPPNLKRKGMGFEVLGKKAYLLGGCGWFEDASDEVSCYDVSTRAWNKVASLTTARCYFACEVLNGEIYVLGGLGLNSGDRHSWDTYDPHINTWRSHSDANVIPDIEDSIVFDGKIYIRSGISSVSGHVCAAVYEPSTGTWEQADADLVSGWRGPAAVVGGTLYVLDQSSGTKLMMWQKADREWVAVGRLSSLLTRPPCRLVAIGKNIYVVGKGLSTVVIDVSSAGSIGGVLVTSSIPRVSYDDVISCKSLAI